MKKFKICKEPQKIPAEGGKLIEELFGKVNSGDNDFSLAHMVAPPGWSEPAQTPEFSEVTLVIKGKMQIEIDDKKIKLQQGESILAYKNNTIKYSNPFDEEAEYYAICFPAFEPEKANRHEK